MTVVNSTLPPGCRYQPTRACAYQPTGNVSYYTADVDFFQLTLGHGMTAPDLADPSLSQSSVDMAGGCISTGQSCKEGTINPCDFYTVRGFACPPEVGIGRPGQPDVIPIGALLLAAGLPQGGLDTTAGDPSHPGPLLDQTLRYAGFTVLVTIVCSNYYEQTASFQQDSLIYRYHISLVRNEAFSGTRVLPGPGSDASARTLVERRGIRIVVRQSGTVGIFDVAVMLLSLTTSLSRLAIAKIVVDLLALYCLPLRHVYGQYMKVATVDFSDMEALGQDVLAQFQSEDLVNHHPAVFDTLDKDGHIRAPAAGTGGTRAGEASTELSGVPKQRAVVHKPTGNLHAPLLMDPSLMA